MITAARTVAVSDAADCLHFARERVDDSFGSVDGSLLAARACAWKVRSRIATAASTTLGHAAFEGGRSWTLVRLRDTRAAIGCKAAVAFITSTTGLLYN